MRPAAVLSQGVSCTHMSSLPDCSCLDQIHSAESHPPAPAWPAPLPSPHLSNRVSVIFLVLGGRQGLGNIPEGWRTQTPKECSAARQSALRWSSLSCYSLSLPSSGSFPMFLWTFHQFLLAFFPPEIRVSALEKEYRHAQVHHIQSIFCENDNN